MSGVTPEYRTSEPWAPLVVAPNQINKKGNIFISVHDNPVDIIPNIPPRSSWLRLRVSVFVCVCDQVSPLKLQKTVV